ncbi:MAG: hypothetical protein RJA44_74 [Pseudomonadota bacterium]
MSTSNLQILEVGGAGLELGAAAIQRCGTLQQAAGLLTHNSFDAVVLHPEVCEAQRLEQWAALPQAVQDTAVLVLLPQVELGLAQRLVRRGVEEVLERNAYDAQQLWRAVVLAVTRQREEVQQRRGGSIDLATGLPTRQQWLDHLGQICAIREHEPAAMAVAVLRLGEFSTPEARLDSTALRLLRRKVAVRLRAALRTCDLAGALAEDSFAVLLAWLERPEAAEQIVARLIAALQRPFSIAGLSVSASVQAGLAHYGEHGTDAEPLLREATLAAWQGAGAATLAERVRRGTALAANDA